MKTVEINVNWNSEKSIELAEQAKAKLENEGYTLINQFGGMTTGVLVYADLAQNSLSDEL